MEALSGLARICLAQGDLSEGEAHVEEILSHLADPAHLPLSSPRDASETLRV